jgi:hypothetical protein
MDMQGVGALDLPPSDGPHYHVDLRAGGRGMFMDLVLARGTERISRKRYGISVRVAGLDGRAQQAHFLTDFATNGRPTLVQTEDPKRPPGPQGMVP